MYLYFWQMHLHTQMHFFSVKIYSEWSWVQAFILLSWYINSMVIKKVERSKNGSSDLGWKITFLVHTISKIVTSKKMQLSFCNCQVLPELVEFIKSWPPLIIFICYLYFWKKFQNLPDLEECTDCLSWERGFQPEARWRYRQSLWRGPKYTDIWKPSFK